MKNSNVIIALVVGLILGLVIGRMTLEPGSGEGRQRDNTAAQSAPGAADMSERAQAAAATEHQLFKAEIDDGWVRGSDSPLVTIVEFSNFACGFCARVQPTISELLDQYGDDLRVVFKHLPLNDAANLSAQATEAAGAQGKFWEYKSLLFQNLRATARPNLEAYAQQLGLDMNRFRADLDNQTFKAKVDGHLASGQSLGVRGTPYFFINGRMLRGAQPIEEFKKVIDEEIERAKKVLAAGVSRPNLYPTLIAGGQSAPQRPEQAERRPEPPARPQFGKPDVTNAHSHGKEDALVTIVEYSNIQCGFCARVRPTLKQIKEEYGDNVRFVYKHQTSPGPGFLVAQAAEAAGEQGKFFEFMDLAFENRREIERSHLEAYAQSLGLNMARFRRAIDQGKFDDRINAHRQEAMQLGARGTPSFFINGRLLAGAQPYPQFKQIIDEEIEKANKLLEEGTKRRDVYKSIIDRNEKILGAQRPQVPPIRPDIQDRLRAKAGDIKQAQQVRPPQPGQNEKVEIDTSTAVFKGNPNAPVTIVEFSSFTCGFCGRVQPTLDQLLKEYDGKVRIAFMNQPMPGAGQLAAQAGMAANEQGKFWEYQKKLFANMRSLDRPNLERYAQELGLDMNRFKAALDTNKFEGVVSKHSQIGRSAGASGTPTFFINGRRLVGAQPIDAFKKLIDEELQ